MAQTMCIIASNWCPAAVILSYWMNHVRCALYYTANMLRHNQTIVINSLKSICFTGRRSLRTETESKPIRIKRKIVSRKSIAEAHLFAATALHWSHSVELRWELNWIDLIYRLPTDLPTDRVNSFELMWKIAKQFVWTVWLYFANETL